MRLHHSAFPALVTSAIFLTACEGGGGGAFNPHPIPTKSPAAIFESTSRVADAAVLAPSPTPSPSARPDDAGF
jgi:hypothetical protein